MDKSERFWDKMAKHQDKDINRFKQAHIKTLESTKKFLNADAIVLDFGCGTGIKTLEIARHVKKIYGIDISAKVIEIAKEKAARYKIMNVDFAQATLHDERYKKESFDIILAFNMLHLFKDNRPIMQRIAEILKPGGLFISISSCLGEKMALLTKLQFYLFLIPSKMGLTPYIKIFKFYELENLLSNEDLQIIETEIFYDRLSGYFTVAKKIKGS